MDSVKQRKFMRVAVFILIALTAINTVLNVISLKDRADLHKTDEMREVMLKARADNQKIFFNALRRSRLLTAEEISVIETNWDASDYDK
jgi:hypothetical protein